MNKTSTVKISLILFIASGLLILAGIPEFWSGNFEYWLITHLLYGIGAVLFLFDK